MKNIDQLIAAYNTKRKEIKERLEEFKDILNQSDERVFAELAFCICTPQSKATNAWNAISTLIKNGSLYNGNENDIRAALNSVRFADNKAKYIIEARNFFIKNGKMRIKERINSFENVLELREWLARDIKGLGYKEASHFLRNIGLGESLSILDRHILKNLEELEVISSVPKTLTKKRYLEIESKMREFSNKIKIPLAELDLLFWSEETGIIFK